MRTPETARERYDRLLASGAYYTEDERVYFDEETRGFVLVHREHATHSFASELVVARSYAALGHQVVLQKEIGVTGRAADADVDGEPWEFKEVTAESANVRNRLQDGMRSARKQGARCVAFHINRATFDEKEARGSRTGSSGTDPKS